MLRVAQVCREAVARVTTNMFVRDTYLGHFNALEDSKLWQTGSHSGAGHSWPLVPRSFLRYNAMGLQETGRPTTTALCWKRQVGLAWWCWPPRLEVDGAWRRLSSSLRWRMRGLSRSPPSLKVGWLHHGPAGAMLACSAARAFAVSLLDRRPVSGTGDVRKRCCEMTGSRNSVRLTSSARGP